MSLLSVQPDSGIAGNTCNTPNRGKFGNVLFADGSVRSFNSNSIGDWVTQENIKAGSESVSSYNSFGDEGRGVTSLMYRIPNP